MTIPPWCPNGNRPASPPVRSSCPSPAARKSRRLEARPLLTTERPPPRDPEEFSYLKGSPPIIPSIKPRSSCLRVRLRTPFLPAVNPRFQHRLSCPSADSRLGHRGVLRRARGGIQASKGGRALWVLPAISPSDDRAPRHVKPRPNGSAFRLVALSGPAQGDLYCAAHIALPPPKPFPPRRSNPSPARRRKRLYSFSEGPGSSVQNEP